MIPRELAAFNLVVLHLAVLVFDMLFVRRNRVHCLRYYYPTDFLFLDARIPLKIDENP